MKYFLLLLCVFSLVACGGSRKEDYKEQEDGIAQSGSGYYNHGGGYGKAKLVRSAALAESAGLGSLDAAREMDNLSAVYEYETEIKESKINRVTPRLVNYNGYITLQAAEPETIIDTVVKRAASKGGSVNNRRNGYVYLQIPVAEFRNFFDWILTLGLVTDKSVSANDITEQYTDNKARLRIAEATLARLQELLAAAKSEQEKLGLLKDIQRVSEQIEQMKIREKELLKQAAFSTINLNVYNTPQPIQPLRPREVAAFNWFSKLTNTEQCKNSPLGKGLKLAAPKDFIETDNKKNWCSASALNAEFWAFEKENNPQGDVNFWTAAVQDFFKNKYKTELLKTENYSIIRLQTADTEPRVFYIAILKSTDKKNLRIAEAYFPNLNAEKKHGDAVKETLGGVK